jgi:branched-chain amino acid transport system substrate-binding protein
VAPVPIRVGILNDMSDGPPGSDIETWVRLAADDLVGAGRLDREVELVHAWGLGLPEGTAAAVERAFAELVDKEVLLVVGPAIGDNALIATPLADRYRIPALNWAGTERGRADYMFHLQVGSHEDESVVIARHLLALGAGRVGVIYDRSPIGRRYVSFLQAEADMTGLRLAASMPVEPLAGDAGDEVESVLGVGVDALVYLGLGLSAPAVADAVSQRGWTGHRVMNTAGMRGYLPDFGRAVDGWAYIDMHSDTNTVLAALRQRLKLGPATGSRPAFGFDLGRLVAESLARAPELTRDGVRDGFEQIKMLPAAEGREGTVLGFGHHDRGALHGPYLVLRQWRNLESVELV